MTDGIQKFSKNSAEVLVRDASGNEQLCFATFNLGTGTAVSSSSSSAVDSVNAKTGTVVLTGADIKTSTANNSLMLSEDIALIKSSIESYSSGRYIQIVDTIPEASLTNVGSVVFYIGTTTSSYTNDSLYQCKTTENTPESVSITTSGTAGIGTVTCNASTFGDEVGEIAGDYEFLYRGYPETIKVEQHSEEKTLTRSRSNDTNGKYGWVDENNNVYLSNVEDVDEDSTFDDVNRTSDFTVMYVETLTRSTAYGSWKWDLGDDFYESVDMSDYGISYNGVALVGAKITITYTPAQQVASTYTWEQVSLT